MCDGSFAHNSQKQPKEKIERKEKKQKLVEKAIPNIADAIKTVVSLSKDEDFKRKCFNLVKVNEEEEFSEVLKKKLWKISACRLNVQPSEEEKSQQVVPDCCELSVDKAKKPPTVKLTTENNAVKEGSGEDYFDDLAREISFYDDQSSNDNCPKATTDHDKNKTTDTLDSGQDSSFELLAELHWDLSEESSESSVHVQESQTSHRENAHACGCEVEKASQQSSALPAQEMQGSVEKGKDLECFETTSDFTSPKAKLRCCKSTLAPTGENTSSNDWLQEFSQDCFWVTDKNIPGKQESEPSPAALKKALESGADLSPSHARISENVTFTDDFDALAELSVIYK